MVHFCVHKILVPLLSKIKIKCCDVVSSLLVSYLYHFYAIIVSFLI
jgi:hypothetical protein